MRQIARRLKDGRIELVEVERPILSPGAAAVRVEASVLSVGTERATLDIAAKGLVAKARARPEDARAVFERVRTEGLRSTVSLVRRRLEELGPLGYSAAGVVLEAGSEARGIAPGERVAIAGGGTASHAEVDVVPSLLCAPLPDGVSFEEGAFTTIGTVALNAFRLGEVGVGSVVAVIGLGLVGQLAVRVARAAGCEVLAVDLKPELLALAQRAGAEAIPRSELDRKTRWHGAADAVLVTAATPSPDPVVLAAGLARDRGRVVVVGDVALELPRNAFYEKELELRVARSYGAGRYDAEYELHGIDYPIGHVRWTEQRNMAAFLALVADGRVSPAELITHRFPFAEAERAYRVLRSDETVVGVVFRYPVRAADKRDVTPELRHAAPRLERRSQSARPRFGLIGAGSFATSTLVPGLLRAGFDPVAVTSSSGLSAETARRRFEFRAVEPEPDALIHRDDVDLIVIATRHESHARLASAALEAGSAVYVEKPLALAWDELAQVVEAQRRTGAHLFVGFNRCHAPLAVALRKLPGPRLMSYRVNAGALPIDHWTNDLRRGGGRLKGEGCHFIDFLCHQVGSDPATVTTRGFPSGPGLALAATDNFTVQIKFADGSVGSVHYAADAPTTPGKERFETSFPGGYAMIDDFRRGEIWQGHRRTRLGGRRPDKGFAAQYKLLAKVMRGDAEPVDPDRFFVSTFTTLAAARALETERSEMVVEQASVLAKLEESL